MAIGKFLLAIKDLRRARVRLRLRSGSVETWVALASPPVDVRIASLTDKLAGGWLAWRELGATEAAKILTAFNL